MLPQVLFLLPHALSIIQQQEQLLSAAVVQLDLQILITNSMIAEFWAKQTPKCVWFLNVNLVIAKGATFPIDSTDTKWLKISSKVTHGIGSDKIAPAYIIDVHGSLKIDSVKITS
jgi:hypothetical protein